MEILGKFKYYKSLLKRYLAQRFGIMKFAGFSIILLTLGINKEIDCFRLFENLVFLISSLFVYRCIDDVWSFHIDRVDHPERVYILPENLKNFVLLVSMFFIVYLVCLFCFSFFLAYTILLLFLFSSILYYFFFKNKRVMTIIPLLKYPILIWCISGFLLSEEIICLSGGVFFMMLSAEFFEKNPIKTKGILIKLLLLLLTGILVMSPWLEENSLSIDILLIAIPLLLMIIPRFKNIYIFHVLIFPVMHIFDLFL